MPSRPRVPPPPPPHEVLRGVVQARDKLGNVVELDVDGFETDPTRMNGRLSLRYTFRPPAADRLPPGYTHLVRIRQGKKSAPAPPRWEIHNMQPKTAAARRKSAPARPRGAPPPRAPSPRRAAFALALRADAYEAASVGRACELAGDETPPRNAAAAEAR